MVLLFFYDIRNFTTTLFDSGSARVCFHIPSCIRFWLQVILICLYRDGVVSWNEVVPGLELILYGSMEEKFKSMCGSPQFILIIHCSRHVACGLQWGRKHNLLRVWRILQRVLFTSCKVLESIQHVVLVLAELTINIFLKEKMHSKTFFQPLSCIKRTKQWEKVIVLKTLILRN